jgi:hypothetical protein
MNIDQSQRVVILSTLKLLLFCSVLSSSPVERPQTLRSVESFSYTLSLLPTVYTSELELLILLSIEWQNLLPSPRTDPTISLATKQSS